MSAGRELRDRGLQQLDFTQVTFGVDPWVGNAMRALEWLARSCPLFDADTLRERVGDPPNPPLMGMVFKRAQREGWIESVGFRVSDRAERHAAPIRTWQGVRDALP